MTPLQRKTLALARTHLGEHETPGKPNQGPLGGIVHTVQAWIGKWMFGEPWCAAFATYTIHEAADELGIATDFIKTASSSAIYTWARQNGRLLDRPIPGCVGLRKAGIHAAKGKSHEHTFFVESLTPDQRRVRTLEGNWGNKVAAEEWTITNHYNWVAIEAEPEVPVYVQGKLIPAAHAYRDAQGAVWAALRAVATPLGYSIEFPAEGVASLMQGTKQAARIAYQLRGGSGYVPVSELAVKLNLSKEWDGQAVRIN